MLGSRVNLPSKNLQRKVVGPARMARHGKDIPLISYLKFETLQSLHRPFISCCSTSLCFDHETPVQVPRIHVFI